MLKKTLSDNSAAPAHNRVNLGNAMFFAQGLDRVFVFFTRVERLV